MENVAAVREDLTLFHHQLRNTQFSLKPFVTANTWLILFDIAVDWLIILLAWYLTSFVSYLLAPISLLMIGNRQRALGNILHDCGHLNLSQSKRINDWIGRLFLTASLFNSLTLYRSMHFQHHARLGDAVTDPDYIHDPGLSQAGNPWSILFKNLFDFNTWKSSLLGHLGRMQGKSFLYVFLWWGAILLIGSQFLTSRHLLDFVWLWLLSRATVFHFITTFREICDHSGLQPGGIFSFSRNVVSSSLTKLFFHPHHNGYHLTHHLNPRVCYRQLPAAHRAYLSVPCYTEQGHFCDSYFIGKNSAIRSWLQG